METLRSDDEGSQTHRRRSEGSEWRKRRRKGSGVHFGGGAEEVGEQQGFESAGEEGASLGLGGRKRGRGYRVSYRAVGAGPPL